MEELEELQKRVLKLEEENRKLKNRLRRNKRKPIRTTKEEIVKYWTRVEDECDLSVDWIDASERCWRCGCKKTLHRCHIIADSLGGKDEPKNFVLLCNRCHIEAPNVEDETFMWDWLHAYRTSLYDTFWKLKAYKEYEFIYKKSFMQELKERDIISDADYYRFWNVKIGRKTTHFGHPEGNTSTDVGILKMKLEAYDKLYGDKKAKGERYRKKETEFEYVIWEICDLAEKYHWDVWQGRSQNPFSVSIFCFLTREKQQTISIKLCRDGIYRACIGKEAEINPNRHKVSDYTIEIGKEKNEVKEFVENLIKQFEKENGRPEKQDFVYTINPIHRLREDLELKGEK